MALEDTDKQQISIRQNFKLNGTNLYTIFDLPIQVTNSIPANNSRPSCDSLNNDLLSQAALNASANNFTRIAGSGLETGGNGLGKGGPGGSGAVAAVDWGTAVHWIWISSFVAMLML